MDERLLRRAVREIIREALLMNSGPSPLSYDRSGAVQRISLVDTAAPGHPKGDTYFATTTSFSWYGPSGRRLKRPKEETVPGAADEGTVAFLDYHEISFSDRGLSAIYIDYMKTRSDSRGKGHARALVDALVEKYGTEVTYDFGRILTPTVSRIKDDLAGRGIKVAGKKDH
ncbi:MAG: hypothetical protein EBZ49_16400 [Proteobacteria bacterium]|nr:hypothetical protein [Pseudomonadota bacterium]